MGTTQPIRSLEEVEHLKRYYDICQPNPRNCLLIQMGLNTALRISDLLRWQDVFDFSRNEFRPHLVMTEQKTKKATQIFLNRTTLAALEKYRYAVSSVSPGTPLFPGKNPDTALSRSQAFRIIRNASVELKFRKPVSCHSLRKTFGYHAWRSGIPPVLLMSIYNHSSFQVTKHYLGIEQDDKDSVFQKVEL